MNGQRKRETAENYLAKIRPSAQEIWCIRNLAPDAAKLEDHFLQGAAANLIHPRQSVVTLLLRSSHMSFPHPATAPARPNRCNWFGRFSRGNLREMATLRDCHQPGFEDSVAPSTITAPRNIIKAISGRRLWATRRLSVRIKRPRPALTVPDVVPTCWSKQASV